MPIFLIFKVFVFHEKLGNQVKLEPTFARYEFFNRHICYAFLEVPLEWSLFVDWGCAQCVTQHCSAKIKASAEVSSGKFNKVIPRNHVEGAALNVVEARRENSSLDETIGMKSYSIDVSLKTLQIYAN